MNLIVSVSKMQMICINLNEKNVDMIAILQYDVLFSQSTAAQVIRRAKMLSFASQKFGSNSNFL